MMDILPLHIEYLLTRHDCVIVPGLGAFIAIETEAHIDFEAGIICPRRREISFNRSVVTDDGLLSHSIARREGISYEDAHRMLAHLSSRMMADLNEEGEVSLGMTGKLVKDSDGLINFQPRRSTILSDIFEDVQLTERQPSNQMTTDETEAAGNEAVEEEEGMRTIKVKADRYVFTVSKRAVHAAAMLITIFTIGLSMLLPINHDNEQKASVISIEDFFRRVKTETTDSKDKSGLTEEKNDSIRSADILSIP